MSSIDAQSPLRRESEVSTKGKGPAGLDSRAPPVSPQRPVSGAYKGIASPALEPQESHRIQYPFSDTEDSGDDAHTRPSRAGRSVSYAVGVAGSPPGDEAGSPDSFDADYDSEGEDAVQMDRYADLKNEEAVKSGYLKKKGVKRRAWKKRWFVLYPTCIRYYKNEKEYELLAIINLKDVHRVAEVELKKREDVFGIVTKQRTYYVQAASEAERNDWLAAIKATCKDAAKLMSPRPRGNSVANRDSTQTRQNSTGSGILNGGVDSSMSALDLQSPSTRGITTSEESLDGRRRPSTVDHKRASITTNGTTRSSIGPSASQTGDIPDTQSEGGGSIATTTESFLTVATTPSMLLAGLNSSSVTAAVPIPQRTDPTRLTTTPITTNFSSSPLQYTPLLSSSTPKSAMFPPVGPTPTQPQATPRTSVARGAGESPPMGRKSEVLSSSEEEDVDEEGGSGRRGDSGVDKDDRVICQGYLDKQGGKYGGKVRIFGVFYLKSGMGWKKRWFVLRGGKLTCYKDDSEYVVRRIIPLRLALDIIEVDTQSRNHANCFQIVLPKRQMVLCAANEGEAKMWVENLRGVHDALTGGGERGGE
ncbi:hypothetical protein HDV00_010008 [Rhizophlyctis rosea]|nr:hypothetical protein HDV00_010008 [Rhizophlyctis rosea]